MNYLDERLKKIRALLHSGEAFLITDDVTRRYAFNFASSAGYGYISQNRCELFLDFRYFEKARIAKARGDISKDVSIVEANKPMREALSRILREEALSTLFFEDTRMTCSAYSALERELGSFSRLEAMGDKIEQLRAVKDDFELARIVQAQRITDAAFSHILSFIERGKTEREIALELEFFMRRNGADGLAFSTICVSGTKSSLPHGEPDDTIVEDGFLTMDFGARFDGYCSDMTRTVCIGTPTEEMKKVYDTVFSAQKAALSVARGGILGKDVDKAARDVIAAAGYEGCFGHATGHSLGLEIHESPNFSPKETQNVPCGAVVSVEPGIYLEGKYGVRIEDIVFLTENGCENLTNSTKEFIIIQ